MQLSKLASVYHLPFISLSQLIFYLKVLIFFFFKLFIYFWLCWAFAAVQAFLQLQGAGFSLQWFLLLQSMAPGALGLQQLWLPGSGLQAQQLWPMGLVAPWHVGSSWIRDQTLVSCTGRRILYYRATREALSRTPLFYFHLALIAVQNDHAYFFTYLFFIPSTRKEGLSEEDPFYFSRCLVQHQLQVLEQDPLHKQSIQ